MFAIDVPKDVRKYKSKFVGPLSFRQTICLLIAGACGYVGYFIQKTIFGAEVDNAILTWIFATPGLALGFVEPYGMPLEKFIQTSFVSIFLAPANRKYKPTNYLRKEIKKAIKQAEKIEKEEKEALYKKDKSIQRIDRKREQEIEKERRRINKEFLSRYNKYR